MILSFVLLYLSHHHNLNVVILFQKTKILKSEITNLNQFQNQIHLFTIKEILL